MKRIAFISCVKTKKNHKCKAGDLYISDLFKKSKEYCLKKYDKVYILSAKYGLLDLNEEIEPYELTLNNMSISEQKKWAYKVYKQIESKIGLEYEFYFFCGKNYRKYLLPKLKGKELLKNLSFGNQLKFYKQNI